MANHTDKACRNQVLYRVFVRNYSEAGSFEGLTRDLDRIQGLGVDILCLMPIYPVGRTGRIGTMGSPYAVRDYRQTDPEIGTMAEFKDLVRAVHRRGMKCILDVVFNAASPDSWLMDHAPQWFSRQSQVSRKSVLGQGEDSTELNFAHMRLRRYLIDTLKQWSNLVDGFWCWDAPMIPVDFWEEARNQVEVVHPGCIWVCQTDFPSHILERRASGKLCHSDGEMYGPFDMTTDYEIYELFREYLNGNVPLSRLCDGVNSQEYIYPENYVKLRLLEAHEFPRFASLVKDPVIAENWLTFLYFLKGAVALYAGQEDGVLSCPSLTEQDPVSWKSGKDWGAYLRQLYWLKKDPLFTESSFHVCSFSNDVVTAVHEKEGHCLVGVFSFRGETAFAQTNLPDGIYDDVLGGEPVAVAGGKLCIEGRPIVLRHNLDI